MTGLDGIVGEKAGLPGLPRILTATSGIAGVVEMPVGSEEKTKNLVA